MATVISNKFNEVISAVWDGATDQQAGTSSFLAVQILQNAVGLELYGIKFGLDYLLAQEANFAVYAAVFPGLVLNPDIALSVQMESSLLLPPVFARKTRNWSHWQKKPPFEYDKEFFRPIKIPAGTPVAVAMALSAPNTVSNHQPYLLVRGAESPQSGLVPRYRSTVEWG
jgi:hypothetical protein